MADNKLIFPPGLCRRRLSPRCRSLSPRSGRRRFPVPARGASSSPPGGEERPGRAGGSLPGPAPLSLALRPAAPAQPQRSAQHGHRCCCAAARGLRRKLSALSLPPSLPARPAGACPAICLYSHSRRQRRGGAAGAPAAAPRPHRPPARRGGAEGGRWRRLLDARAPRRRSAPRRPSCVCE